MTPAGKQALLDAVAGGKPFIGTHCASDTFHSPGSEEIPNFKGVLVARYHNDGEKADPYIKMLGGEFIIHGQQQPSHLIVADPTFPGMSGVPANNDMKEEWYSLKDYAPDIHVLLVNSTAGMEGNPYNRPNYPSTWARMYGKGRVFYSSLGHRDDMWQSAHLPVGADGRPQLGPRARRRGHNAQPRPGSAAGRHPPAGAGSRPLRRTGASPACPSRTA